MKNILFIAYLIKLVFIFILKYLSYIGDTSIESEENILRYFTMEDIKIGEEYSRKGFLISLISNFIDIGILLSLTFLGYAKKLEDFFSNKTKNSFFLTSILFITFCYTINFIIDLPFSYYFEFILEHQFGFSNMNLTSWLILNLKNFILGLLGVIVTGLGLIYILKIFMKSWIFVVPIASILFGLIISVVFPVLITPLYYDTSEIEDGTLKEKILILCEKEKISITNVYIINESEYSNHTNAYFTGWGKDRKIFLYDTLIKNHTEEEIISILGHEIGHWKYNHQIKDIILSGIILFIGCIITKKIFELSQSQNKLNLEYIYSPSSLPILILIFSLLNFINSPIENYLSRNDETEADLEALILTLDKDSFISTEIKMAKDNKSRLNPHPIVEWFYYSHPKTLDRIKLAEDYKN
jgi:STE24 endopeptidase